MLITFDEDEDEYILITFISLRDILLLDIHGST